jgi:hypothetical protein
VLVKAEMRQLLVGPAQLERCITDLRTTMCHYNSEADVEDRLADYDERGDYDDHTTAASRLEAPSSSAPISDNSVDDDGPLDTYFSRDAQCDDGRDIEGVSGSYNNRHESTVAAGTAGGDGATGDDLAAAVETVHDLGHHAANANTAPTAAAAQTDRGGAEMAAKADPEMISPAGSDALRPMDVDVANYGT